MNERYVVLVVDDSLENLRVLGDMLELEGYVVRVATNGPQALQTVKKSPPDLILLDILMPLMDGYEVCRRLKDDQETCMIPVIFISALGMANHKVTAFKAGGVDYITKPFHVEEVAARVHTHIQLARAEELKREIAERKLAEEKNLRLVAIVESSDDAIASATMDGIVTSWNQGAENIFGYQASEMLNHSLSVMMPVDSHNRILRLYSLIMRGEHVDRFETVYRRKDGRDINVSLSFSPVRNSAGNVVELSIIGRDISERVRLEQERMINERMNRELEIAHEIQKSFLGVCPADFPGVKVACCCMPAAHVGGDYYDFFKLENGYIDVVIADASGHSVSAALLMMEARSVLHAKVVSSRTPGQTLAIVNDLLCDDLVRSELQISMFYVRFDLENHSISYANAGHTRPLLYKNDSNDMVELDADGLLLGIYSDVKFEDKVCSFLPGDLLFMYTDGVTESQDSSGELFGDERLSELIRAYHENSPDDIVTAVSHEIESFTGSKAHTDDVSMVVIKHDREMNNAE